MNSKHTKNKCRKNGKKDGQVLHKLMNNAVSRKKKKNLRNRIDVKLVNNEKDYLKCTWKPSYMLHKIFHNNSGVIWKSKVSFTLNKPASIGMRILELGKVLMYEFHYDYIKNKYDNKSKLLFKETDSLMHGIKTEGVYENFSSNKEMFDFSDYSSDSKYYDDSNKLVIGKMKDETGGVAIEEFVSLKLKMYSFLVPHNSKHKKAKGMNKNVATISHSKYKDVLLNNKCLRHS